MRRSIAAEIVEVAEPIPPPCAPTGPFERWLDSLSCSGPACAGAAAPPYLVAGVAGVATGLAVLFVSGIVAGARLSELLPQATAAAAAFVAAGLVRSARGRGPHILLEDVLLVLAVTAGTAWLVDAPVRSSVDRVTVAVGACLVFGRLGCLASGCCHGRPARLGVRYPDGSISPALVGVRLWPLPFAESVWIAVVTVTAATLLGNGPGVATAAWLLAYGVGRFAFEFVRGDLADSRCPGPLSRQQWVVIGIVVALAVAQAWESMTWRDAGGVSGALVLLVLGWFTRRGWWSVPRPVVSVETIGVWNEMLDQLEERLSRHERGEVGQATPVPGIDVVANLDPAGPGQALVAYRVVAPDRPQSDRELIGALIASRLPAFRFLRAEPTVDGYVLWALVPAVGELPRVTSTAWHALLRARGFAFVLRRLDLRVAAPALPSDVTYGDSVTSAPIGRR
jgi:prolipoprotein diacylglyceryltransferase